MPDILIDTARQKMVAAINLWKSDLSTLRTGRAAPSLIENLEITAYGVKMPLIQLATIHAPDPATLVINPFDINNIDSIVKGIQEANLGMTPVSDNTVIRITISPMTSEKRFEFVKMLHVKLEGAKVMIRQIRRDAMEDINKNSENEDETKRLEKILQELTDEMIAEVEVLGENKEKELLTI